MVNSIIAYYRQDHLLEAGNKIIEALGEHNKYAGDSQLKLGDATVQKCFAQLVKSYDPNMGGFSKAPKFPQVIPIAAMHIRTFCSIVISENIKLYIAYSFFSILTTFNT